MKEIFERKSIRRYSKEQVTDDQIKELLKAAMAAPSAANKQPWEFVIIRERDTFEKIMKVHPYSSMLSEASAAIVVCSNTKKELGEGYGILDCSAATENILLMAQSIGLGAVWLGVYPRDERMTDIRKILTIPEDVIPLNIISIGYPAEVRKPEDRYREDRLHYGRW